ncbi:MAG TPA: hypothetical protein VF528_17705 [Pyrinomonadaceae bacterium]
MKAVTTRMLLSLVGVVLVAPFFVVALIVGARAVALSQSTQDDVLMMVLAFGGAIASIVNGLGRRNYRLSRAQQMKPGTNVQREAVDSSVIGLGY